MKKLRGVKEKKSMMYLQLINMNHTIVATTIISCQAHRTLHKLLMFGSNSLHIDTNIQSWKLCENGSKKLWEKWGKKKLFKKIPQHEKSDCKGSMRVDRK